MRSHRVTGMPFLLRFFNPAHLVCKVPGPERVIYLTFDDGPVPEVTPEILTILREYQAKATFFLVGDNVRKYPELLQALLDEGHGIGNHTFHHLNGWKTPPAAYEEDVLRCNGYFRTRLFRPPYGKFTPSQYFLLRSQFRFVLWSVLTYDFSHRITPARCLEGSVRKTLPGSVVVFHDHLKAAGTLFHVLPEYLRHFAAEGYRFEALPWQVDQITPSSAKL